MGYVLTNVSTFPTFIDMTTTTASAGTRILGLGFVFALAPVLFALSFWFGWALCSLTFAR